MTKQELEEKIKNGKSVWGVVWNILYELKTRYIQKISKCEIEYFDKDRDFYLEVNLLDIFKTKAEAEHYLHHANITRTEILPFLTWEEFDKGNRLIRFIGKNGEKCKLEGYQKDDKQSGFIDVVVNGTGSHIDFDYTEANFYKAYDECVRLFKGE